MRNGPTVGVAAFVGRGRERARIADLVVGGRVVTLTGSGGCGKTRLATEVVRDVTSRFADGARWVDLQGIQGRGQVAGAVAEAVAVHNQPGRPLPDALAALLTPQHVLLVLDNCEHVMAGCAELVDGLTSTCPRLHVLATSRVPLAVQGEATYEVAGLPVPRADAFSASEVASADAARLFEVRARQVSAEFRIDDGNAPAVAEICRRLDGIPLAIELAAARVRVLAPRQIAAGLSDRFALLRGGARGAPARQRTLEASIEWSHALLDDAQRLALARLSVFAGSFELDAAEAVVAGAGIDRTEVLDLVAGLIEHSMVQVTKRRGSARYRLLETIRVHARERLAELDDPIRLRDRHLAFHVELARRAQAGLHGGEPEPWIARLGYDIDDLRAAMDWAADRGDLSGLVGVTEPIVRYWFERGLSREVHRRLHDAASAPHAPVHERVRGLNTAAALALSTYEPATIHRSATTAVAAARAAGAGAPLALALAHRALSGILSGRSATEQVTADVEEALDHAERSADASTHAHVLQFAGAALLHGHSIDAGRHLYRRCLELCEAEHLAFHLPAAHGGAQAWLPWSGRLDEARRHAWDAVTASRRLGRAGWEAAGLAGLAACSVLQGDHGDAYDRLSEARAALRPHGLEQTHYGMWVRHWQALAAYAADDLEAARTTAEDIVQVARGGGSRLDEAVGEWLLGLVAQGREPAAARRHLEASRELSTRPRLPHTLGRSLLGLAQLAVHDDQLEDARELAHESLEVLDAYGDRVGAATALETVAGLAATLGDPERALRLLAACHRFHEETGIARFPAQAASVEHARGAAQQALGDVRGAAHWDAGRDLSLAEAIAYARRGRGERRRPTAGWASLTPTERDVVALVVDGRTNAEIGGHLFISVNTVKKHLTHVYAKLAVDGRTELAAEAARRVL